ncbi:hypothetical protein ACFQ1S_13710, partial [Kibdelosporangium lantanae]
MDEILGQVLRNAVWERLDMLSELANRADAPSLLSVARSELPRLTEGWRAMLFVAKACLALDAMHPEEGLMRSQEAVGMFPDPYSLGP